ncbi:MAG: hypothetical protein KF819_01305 [Labilithrix sp.]|nr:hypothetical protein [Labilithrix sp.]
MKVKKLRKGLALVIAASAFGLGCELIVDFDRTKIPVEGTDATPQPTPDGGGIDTGVDTGQDVAVDAPAEASDAGSDAADTGDADDPDAI